MFSNFFFYLNSRRLPLISVADILMFDVHGIYGLCKVRAAALDVDNVSQFEFRFCQFMIPTPR